MIDHDALRSIATRNFGYGHESALDILVSSVGFGSVFAAEQQNLSVRFLDIM
jgi:hypothetical protein